MKRILCVLLAVLLFTSLGMTVLAEENKNADAEVKDGNVEVYEENGIAVTIPEMVEDLRGSLIPYPMGVMNNGLGMFAYLYFGMSEEELNLLMDKPMDEITEADMELIRSKQGSLVRVVSIDKGRTLPDLLSLFEEMGMEGLTEENFTEIGRAGETSFYLMDDSEGEDEYLACIAPAYQKEFKALKEAVTEALKNAELSEPPVPGADIIGTVVSFETTDIDGNPVKSEDIFKGYDVTMVNVWATWCHNCVDEMTALGEMSRRLSDKNVQVIGICTDADEKLDECKEILKEHNVDYLNLMPVENLNELVDWNGTLPYSYFFGSDGTMLCRGFMGAPSSMEAYENVIDSLLNDKEVEMEELESSRIRANKEGVYRVFVSDSDGDMVKGATIQFCSDSMCMMAKTDENGMAVFEAEEGDIYTIHMLKVPAGYVKTGEEFKTEGSYCDICIALEKDS